jgi:large subunit ribosomal protein L19
MSRDVKIQKFEQGKIKKDLPEFKVGDTVRIHTKIVEEGGKERVQAFTGTVIAHKGTGLSETISLHRVAYGEGMERVVFVHSPLVVKIELVKHGKVRRGKLYYLRGKSGKAARIKGRFEQEVEASKEAVLKPEASTSSNEPA